MKNVKEMIKTQSGNEWELEACAELCEMAGMSEEWEAADGDTFESVVYAAAEKLGIQI